MISFEYYSKLNKSDAWKLYESRCGLGFKYLVYFLESMCLLAEKHSEENKYVVRKDTALLDQVVILNNAPMQESTLKTALEELIRRRIIEKVGSEYLYNSEVDRVLKTRDLHSSQSITP